MMPMQLPLASDCSFTSYHRRWWQKGNMRLTKNMCLTGSMRLIKRAKTQ